LNKNGDIQSIIFAVVIIVSLGFILFFFSMVFDKIYSNLEGYFESNPKYDNTEVTETIRDIRRVEQSVWDYAFLGIVIGYIILIGIFGFTQSTSPVFFWLSVLLSLIGLFVGVVMGNVWQGMVASTEPNIVATVTRFPIMNKILGTYYPTIVTFIIMLGLVTLYGKPSGGER
jgi:hypothetical protein